MTEMLKRSNLKKNKKGFTLVEIIVVLVIIAILAAIAIPTMLGFVNEARQSEFIAEGRTALVAAQTIVTRETALETTDVAGKVTLDAVKAITGTGSKVVAIGAPTIVDGQITKFVCYVTKDGQKPADGKNVNVVTIDTTTNSATCSKGDIPTT